MSDAERPRNCLLPINILNNILNFGAFKKKLCHSNLALVCLRANTGQKVGRNYVLDDIRCPGSKESYTMLLPESCAEVY